MVPAMFGSWSDGPRSGTDTSGIILANVPAPSSIVLRNRSQWNGRFRRCFADILARCSLAFRKSVSADRIVMVASRLLAGAAACEILLSFAAGHRKSYWSGCIKAAIVICQPIFSILALVTFLLKLLSKSASKSSFFCSGVEIPGFGAAISHAVAHSSSIVLSNSVSKIALEWLSQGCCGWTKAAIVTCQQIFSILALAIFQ